MATQADDYGGDYGVSSPQDVWTGVNEQEQKTDSEMPNKHLGAINAIYDRATSQFDPRVTQAYKTQGRMRDILAAANEGADPNENPLDYQMRVARAMSIGLGDVNPQASLRAMDTMSKLTQAKEQQRHLQSMEGLEEAQTGEAKANTAQKTLDTNLNKITGGTMLLQGPADPKNPLAERPTLGSYSLYDKDGNYDQTEYQRLMDDRAKFTQQGQQVEPISAKQASDARLQVAQMRAYASMQDAQTAASAKLQAALIAAQNKGSSINGQQGMMMSRIFQGAEMGSTILGNIVNMPIGSRTGVFGSNLFANSGKSVLNALAADTKNTLTNEDAQRYQAISAGLEQNLTMIEKSGGLQGGQAFAQNIRERLSFQQGDSMGTVMTKLADARQIIEKGTQIWLKNPKLDPVIKENVEESLNSLRQSIPFTVNDVTNWQKAAEKNPQMSLQQYIKANKLGDVTGAGSVEAAPGGSAEAPKQYKTETEAAMDSSLQDGDTVIIGGRKATYHK